MKENFDKIYEAIYDRHSKREWNYAKKACETFAKKVFVGLKKYLEDESFLRKNNGFVEPVLFHDSYDNDSHSVGDFIVKLKNEAGDMDFPGWDIYEFLEKFSDENLEELKSLTPDCTDIEVKKYIDTKKPYLLAFSFGPNDPIVTVKMADSGDKWENCLVIDVDDDTPSYKDALYGVGEDGKRLPYGKGGYHKEIDDFEKATRKDYRVVFEFEEDSSLNYKSKPMSAANAIKEYYNIFNENPSYKKAVEQRTLDIYIKDAYGKVVDIDALEELVKKFGKTKAAQEKRRPEPIDNLKWAGHKNPVKENELNESTPIVNEFVKYFLNKH